MIVMGVVMLTTLVVIYLPLVAALNNLAHARLNSRTSSGTPFPIHRCRPSRCGEYGLDGRARP